MPYGVTSVTLLQASTSEMCLEPTAGLQLLALQARNPTGIVLTTWHFSFPKSPFLGQLRFPDAKESQKNIYSVLFRDLDSLHPAAQGVWEQTSPWTSHPPWCPALCGDKMLSLRKDKNTIIARQLYLFVCLNSFATLPLGSFFIMTISYWRKTSRKLTSKMKLLLLNCYWPKGVAISPDLWGTLFSFVLLWQILAFCHLWLGKLFFKRREKQTPLCTPLIILPLPLSPKQSLYQSSRACICCYIGTHGQ